MDAFQRHFIIFRLEELERRLKDTTQTTIGGSSSVLCNSSEERRVRLREQREKNEFNRYVNNNLILKQGYCEKKVVCQMKRSMSVCMCAHLLQGLFARNRMFLLTEGPHLYYVDVSNQELKGEVPFSAEMVAEARDFKTFMVHTVREVKPQLSPTNANAHYSPSASTILWTRSVARTLGAMQSMKCVASISIAHRNRRITTRLDFRRQNP